MASHHSRARSVRPRLVAGMVVLSLLTSCNSTAPSGTEVPDTIDNAESSSEDAVSATSSAPGDPALVDGAGLTLALGELTFTAAPGVAPEGTHLQVDSRPLPEFPTELGDPLPGSSFSIAFTDGSQPASPVTVELTVPDAADQPLEAGADAALPDSHIVLLTRPADATDWTALPVTVDGGMASAHLEHFSEGFFARVRSGPAFVTAITDFLRVTYPPPDCLGATATHDGRTYTVTVDHPQFIYPCVSVDAGGQVLVTVHSNSPNAWRVRGVPGVATPLPPDTGADPVGALMTVTHSINPTAPAHESMLAPGAAAGLTVIPGTESTYFDLRLDAGYSLLGILWAGLLGILGPLGVSDEWDDIIATGSCLTDALELGQDQTVDARWIATNTPGLIGCASAWLQVSGRLNPVVSFALTIVSSLAGLLAGQIYGIYTQFATDLGHTRVHLTSVLEDDLVVGGWPTGRSDSAGGLYMWLGAAGAWGEVSIGYPDWVACSGDVCLAGDAEMVSVIGQSETGYFEAAAFPANADARQSLHTLGLDESTIDTLLAPASSS